MKYSNERFSEKRMRCKGKSLTLARRKKIHCSPDEDPLLRRRLRSEKMRFEKVEVALEGEERRNPIEGRGYRA